MLEIKDLTCGYESGFFLRNINLAVRNNELVGIIGPNGSGKTSLLRAISGALKAKSGAVFFEKKDISKMPFKELAKKIAVVSQNFETGCMGVEEFVLMGRIPHFEGFRFLETKKDFETAKRCMVLTDTFRLKERLLSEISGGERQLAHIARALAQEPKLLLLDEPTTHLDITHQVRILDLIKRLNKKFELTAIMVLHDLNLASEYCHRLVLLNEGEVCKTGHPEEVIDYETIRKVYRTRVAVEKNPISSRPHIFVVSEEENQR